MKNKKTIPFTFLTNGGMETEQSKADKLNNLFKLNKNMKLTVDHINVCHTVFGSPEI